MPQNNIRKSLIASGSGVQVSHLSNELAMLVRPSEQSSRRKFNRTRDAVSSTLSPLFDYVAAPSSATSALNLHNVGVSQWTQYFMDGKAAMVVSKMFGYAVGYARLATRMDSKMMGQLSISSECPEVFELGNLAVAPPFQDLGLANKLIGQLVDLNRVAMNSGRMLIIGTMTGRAAARAFKSVFESKGHTPEFRHHLDFPSIAPLTCKCTTNGTGFNISASGLCSIRVPQAAQELAALNGSITTYTSTVPTKLPCVLFVSNPDVAVRVDQVIGDRYPSIQDLVSDLHRTGYY